MGGTRELRRRSWRRELHELGAGVFRREPGLWRELPLGHERVHARGELDVAHPAGGTFDMGSTSGDSNETPVHAVTVPGFEMLATEVTVAQYEACVNDGGACTAPGTGTLQLERFRVRGSPGELRGLAAGGGLLHVGGGASAERGGVGVRGAIWGALFELQVPVGQ